MPITEQTKQTIGHDAKDGQIPVATQVRKPATKAAGTRMSIMEDWRGVANSGNAQPRRVQAIRDGR